MDPEDRRVREERARIEAEYRRVLKSSVLFEKRIRDRWRQKVREKNERIATLEARVADLERRLLYREAGKNTEEDVMDRGYRERKLVALIVNDLAIATEDEGEVERTRAEVRGLSDEELDGMLAERLGLSRPPDASELELALNGVEEPERLSEGTVGAPDMSHNPGPGENEE